MNYQDIHEEPVVDECHICLEVAVVVMTAGDGHPLKLCEEHLGQVVR